MERSLGQKRPRPRIETMADLVFALSLSIGSIALIAGPPTSTGEIDSHILAFTFTFLILITAWMVYTTQMSVLPVETRVVTFLNILLLLMVALVPYLLNTVGLVNSSLSPAEASIIRDHSSTLFALDLSGILLILGTFAHIISVEETALVEPEIARLFRNGRNRMAILAGLMALSILPQFWEWKLLDVPVRLYMWYLPLVSYWVGRAVRPDSRSYRIS